MQDEWSNCKYVYGTIEILKCILLSNEAIISEIKVINLFILLLIFCPDNKVCWMAETKGDWKFAKSVSEIIVTQKSALNKGRDRGRVKQKEDERERQ